MVPYITSIVQTAKNNLAKRQASRGKKLPQRKTLHLESLEPRAMLAGDMAEITGLVLNDLQGDNISSNDVAESGVAVALYQDGGNGKFDNGGGDDIVAAPSTTTNGDGRYSFAGVGAGTYFVQINPGTELHTREGEDVRTVVVSTAEAEGVIGRTIDGFETAQGASASPPLPSSTPSSLLDPNVLGGQRDLFVELTDGDDQFTRVALQSGAGLLRLASDPDITGNAKVIWDGNDNDAANVDPTGLRGIDGANGIDLSTFEGNTMTGVSLTVGADHADTLVTLKVYTDANNWSEYTTTVPESDGGKATKTAIFQFASGASETRGNGADLTNVGAIELNFVGVSAVDGQVSIIELVGLTPKKADFTVYDKLSLGDHVWGELLNDGIRSATEQGIPNVKLNLYEDSNQDEKYTSGVDKLMGMEFTDGDGDYLFTNLFPGKYVVQVDPSNFEDNGPLVGLSSSTGNGTASDPDDNINGDDNGDPLTNLGVVSRAIMLTSGDEPINDGDNDANTNLTVDFGFFGFDLELDKSVDEQVAVPGEQLHFSVVITNSGPSTAQDVLFTDTLPAEVSYVSGSISTGATLSQDTSGNLTANLGDMVSGATITVNILADVPQGVSGKVKNIAEVFATDEVDTSNNMDMVMIPIEPHIDLQIVKSDSSDPVVQGETFSYTLVAKNNGPSDATEVVISDILPDGVSFVSATPAQTSFAGNKVMFSVGDLAVGDSTSVTINVRVDDNFSGTLLNEAWVEGKEIETRLDNNHDDEPTVVLVREIDLAITKTDSRDPVEPGGVFSYELVVSNNGPYDATGVVVSDILPEHVAFQSATPAQTSFVDDKVMFAIGDLAVGDTRTIQINVQVDNDFVGTLFNEAWVEGNETETRTDNNHDDEPTQVVLEPASVSGAVFVDRNDNGQLDAGERRIPDVEVTLIGTDFRGDDVSLTQKTKSDGTYAFIDLMPGNYRVIESQPATLGGRRLFDGKDELGDNGDGLLNALDGLKAPDLNADDDRDSDAFEGITLNAGNNGTDYNFGELMVGLTKKDFIRGLNW